MATDGIAWDNWTRLREDGLDLIFLMREGEPKYSWEEWMEGFTDELKASYTAYKEQRLAQKKLDRKIGFFLALILTKLEKVESLLAERSQTEPADRTAEADEEISSRLECIKDYIKHVIKLQDQGGKHNEAGQNTTGSADGTSAAEHSEAGLHRSGAVVPSGA